MQPPFHKSIQNTPTSRQRAKDLRSRLSPPEGILWSRLRRKQVAGLRFRRQHPIGPYIVDFYCHDAALVVEVDGISFHLSRQYEHDKRRHEWLTEQRLLVLRVSASSIARDLDGVVTRIRLAAVRRVAELHPGAIRGSDPDEFDEP